MPGPRRASRSTCWSTPRRVLVAGSRSAATRSAVQTRVAPSGSPRSRSVASAARVDAPAVDGDRGCSARARRTASAVGLRGYRAVEHHVGSTVPSPSPTADRSLRSCHVSCGNCRPGAVRLGFVPSGDDSARTSRCAAGHDRGRAQPRSASRVAWRERRGGGGGAATFRASSKRARRRMSILTVVIIVLVVLLILGYFGRGRFGR